MIYPLTDLNSWPLMENGQPFLKTSNEALLYAQLIYERPDKQKHLAICRAGIHKAIYQERDNKDPNFDIMMILAARAQFYRECLEECQRIKNENHSIPYTGPREKGA